MKLWDFRYKSFRYNKTAAQAQLDFGRNWPNLPQFWAKMHCKLAPPTLSLVIVGAAQVVAAMSADQLAAVSSEAMAAVGANLAVMVDGKNVFGGAERTTLRDFRGGIGSKAGI